jgi:hypothetical protein
VNKQDHDRLKEIREEMLHLVDEAKRIISNDDKSVYERARVYWVGNILHALDDGNYITKYDYTMQNTIDDLEPSDDDLCPMCKEELADDEEGAYCPECGYEVDEEIDSNEDEDE